MNSFSRAQFAAFINHTLLKADASRAEIEKLCAEAREHHFFSVCVNGSWIADARHFLEDSDVKVAGVAGFPLGAMTSDAKRFEAEAAIDDGAHEIEVVINLARLKAGDDQYILRELIDVAEAADERNVKVILETGLLTDEEKIRACRLAVESGAHGVKTSTGFAKNGATVADVALMRETVGEKFGVEAFCEFSDAKTARAMIDAGATRLGTFEGTAMIAELEPANGSY